MEKCDISFPMLVWAWAFVSNDNVLLTHLPVCDLDEWRRP